MNPIMGKLTSGVAQLLMSSAAKAMPGEAVAAAGGAALPFAALISQLAAKAGDKSVAIPGGETTGHRAIVADLTLADLPFTDILEKTVSKAEPAQVSGDEISPETEGAPAPQLPACADVTPSDSAGKSAKPGEAANIAPRPVSTTDLDRVTEDAIPERKTEGDPDSDVGPPATPQLAEGVPVPTIQPAIAAPSPPVLPEGEPLVKVAARAVSGTPQPMASASIGQTRTSARLAPNFMSEVPGRTEETLPIAGQIEAAAAFLAERSRRPGIANDVSTNLPAEAGGSNITSASVPIQDKLALTAVAESDRQSDVAGEVVANLPAEAGASNNGVGRPRKQDGLALSGSISRLRQSIPADIAGSKAADSRAPVPMAISLPQMAEGTDVEPGGPSTIGATIAPQAQPAPTSAPAPFLTGAPVADLSASLGQQVIDMGSGGQWIDGLAREIATLSKGEGHGSFRLSPAHLGPMRVDIRPGEQGSNVTLTVETKAAESMLMQDRNLLKADAQLAAVKIGDVTVERVPHIHEPARADTANGQGSGGQPHTQTSSQGQSGQNSGQGALAQGQSQSQQNGNYSGNRKDFSGAAVSSQAEPSDAGTKDKPQSTRGARYA